jgi:hypothetical protein
MAPPLEQAASDRAGGEAPVGRPGLGHGGPGPGIVGGREDDRALARRPLPRHRKRVRVGGPERHREAADLVKRPTGNANLDLTPRGDALARGVALTWRKSSARAEGFKVLAHIWREERARLAD